jgi:hypothetical protein
MKFLLFFHSRIGKFRKNGVKGGTNPRNELIDSRMFRAPLMQTRGALNSGKSYKPQRNWWSASETNHPTLHRMVRFFSKKAYDASSYGSFFF